jgi:hypothetical protein
MTLNGGNTTGLPGFKAKLRFGLHLPFYIFCSISTTKQRICEVLTGAKCAVFYVFLAKIMSLNRVLLGIMAALAILIAFIGIPYFTTPWRIGSFGRVDSV